jgi:hypothetical protein
MRCGTAPLGDWCPFQDNVMVSFSRVEMSNKPQISQHENNLVLTGDSKQEWNDKQNVPSILRNVPLAQFLMLT